ncbi:uncharacterized protein LOC124405111 [Diprion similis]|uniref:uncharacterized protein LOC124405111 n=1 Tax=Diprion similis TaxID=362088 RepID=UPI001EF7B954|nr:uncharacterized protein LOC124405111 [Diprion similis]
MTIGMELRASSSSSSSSSGGGKGKQSGAAVRRARNLLQKAYELGIVGADFAAPFCVQVACYRGGKSMTPIIVNQDLIMITPRQGERAAAAVAAAPCRATEVGFQGGCNAVEH